MAIHSPYLEWIPFYHGILIPDSLFIISFFIQMANKRLPIPQQSAFFF